MFQPKPFYRELDGILHEIDLAKADERWFTWIVDEIVKRFGPALCIQNGRLYTDAGSEFVLDHDYNSRDPGVAGLRLPASYRPLALVQQHGVFIFDETVAGQSPEVENRLAGYQSAALLVESQPRRILAFGLRSGWDRDHLDFALRTVRNAINHKLTFLDLKIDLDQASEIQRSLLPAAAPNLPGFSIAARSVAAASVGGDFYEFILHPPEMIELAVGDASGHGLAAALLARDVMTGLRMGSERDLKITALIRQLNRVVARSSLSTRFISLFFCELEANGNISYVNAGHPPPWIVGRERTERLKAGGIVLGPVEDARFRRGFARMELGDVLVIVTDGLLERADAGGRHFDDAGVEEVVRKHLGVSAEEILERLFQTAFEHGVGRPWLDDTTALVAVREA